MKNYNVGNLLARNKLKISKSHIFTVALKISDSKMFHPKVQITYKECVPLKQKLH